MSRDFATYKDFSCAHFTESFLKCRVGILDRIGKLIVNVGLDILVSVLSGHNNFSAIGN